MTAKKASSIAAAVGLPVWVTIVCTWTVAFSDDYNPPGVLLWPGFALIIAVPFGWIIGYLVSPLMYHGYSRRGARRYIRTLIVHAAAGAAVFATYSLLMSTPINPVIGKPMATLVVYASMLGPSSLIGTLVYAYFTSPQVAEPAA